MDLGWPETDAVRPDNPWDGDPISWIVQLGRDDMLDRRTALTTAGVYSLAAATSGAALTAILTSRDQAGAGQSDVSRIRHMTRVFADVDDLHGGGHARATVAAYLAHDVAPLLRRAPGDPGLYAAAAELTYLAGWMAADDGQAGLAQRYYIQSVRLADVAGDPLLRVSALRSMAVQAVDLGHVSTGLALAEAANRALPAGAPLRTQAWITGIVAEATAAAGGAPREARRLLHHAGALLDRADSPPEGQWIGNYRRPGLHHQIGLTLQHLGDLPGAERHLTTSLSARGRGERRSRALIGSRLAEIQLRRQRPDVAAATVLSLADDLASVSSARVHHTLTGLRTSWRPHRADPTVAAADWCLSTTSRPAL